MYIYECEDSIEGIFTGVYDAWMSGEQHNNTKVVISNQYTNIELFSEYIEVKTSHEKAEKVAESIKNKISNDAYSLVVRAALSEGTDKADMIYRFLILGFKVGAKVTTYYADNAVMNIFELNRYVGNEAHFYTGFLRFSEVSEKALFAKYEPKCNITEIIMPHFVDRFPDEYIIILDVRRKTAGFYMPGNEWFISQVSDGIIEILDNENEKEEKYKSLWKTFFKSIAIEPRKNSNLQRSMLRLHYRKHMTEFIP